MIEEPLPPASRRLVDDNCSKIPIASLETIEETEWIGVPYACGCSVRVFRRDIVVSSSTRIRENASHNATLTLCFAVAAGAGLYVAGRQLRVPPVLLYLVAGVVLGPELVGWIDPASLGGGLEALIALAVAVVLFEGGMTLELGGYRRSPIVIRRLVIIGAMVTWLGASAAAWLLFDLEPAMALLAGSLVIVTGPTVVSPLLRRILVKERVHHALYWEAVLVEAVGVFIAVLCYEWLTPDREHPLWQPLDLFGLRIAVGVGLGFATGSMVARALENGWVSDHRLKGFVLSCALLTFGVAHVFVAESGILAVVVAGLVIGARQPGQITRLRRSEIQVGEHVIGALCIMLAAQVELAQFAHWRVVAMVAIVVALLRPAVVWLATWGRGFDLREKLILSWIAPRGVVAAAMASLFAVRLAELGHPEAVALETIALSVVAATVTIQGLSAPWVVRVLGVERADRRSWVILGHSALVAALGRSLRAAGVKVVELTGSAAVSADPDDPRFADAQAVLCAHTTMVQNVWAAVRFGLPLRKGSCFRWATFQPDPTGRRGDDPAGRAVWTNALTAAAVAVGLEDGTHAIDVVEVSAGDEEGRFGTNFQPLFWVADGVAQIVVNPLDPGPPTGDLAVVLRRRVPGLFGLVAHVQIIDTEEPSFESVLGSLAEAAAKLQPDLGVAALVQGILDRRESMPAAIGGGVAIPHGYCDGLERSRCYLAVVPNGVADMVTPDQLPVCLVFLLISPLGAATKHILSLAALASIAEESAFVHQLRRQRVPQRIVRLIEERAS